MPDTKISELKARALDAKTKYAARRFKDDSFDTIESSLAAPTGNKALPGPTYPTNVRNQKQTEQEQEYKKDNRDSDGGADGAPAEPEGGLGGTNLGLTPAGNVKEGDGKSLGTKGGDAVIKEDNLNKAQNMIAKHKTAEEQMRQINMTMNKASAMISSKKDGDRGYGE